MKISAYKISYLLLNFIIINFIALLIALALFFFLVAFSASIVSRIVYLFSLFLFGLLSYLPLNKTAVEMIKDLRRESYYGENTPLVCGDKGDYTKPVNLRKRFYRILKAAGIKRKGLHSLRHTFATNLGNGVKREDGTIKALSPRQVADLLGHSTSQITELYYVKKDTSRLSGITEGFEM